MLIDWNDLPDGESSSDVRSADSAGKWNSLFQMHPEGGGPFGGRDNALFKMCAFMRAKTVPFQAAREFAIWWDRQYCSPPLGTTHIDEVFSRGWARWREGGLADSVPDNGDKETVGPLTVAELLAIADDPDKQLKWIAEDFIQENGVTVLSATSGHGKSWLALDLCRYLTSEDEFGKWLDKYEIPKQGVLYLDGEAGDKSLAKRIKALGYEGDNERFFCWPDTGFKLENAADRTKIARACEEKNLKFIVVDPLVAFHNQDENQSGPMRKVGEWLRSFVLKGYTVLALHHDRKSNGIDGTDADKTRGSGDITAFSQTVLGLTLKDEIYTLSIRKIKDAKKTTAVSYVLNTTGGRMFLDVPAAQEVKEELSQQRQEDAFAFKVTRYKDAVAQLTKSGEIVTIGAIARAAKMRKQDVVDVQAFVSSEELSKEGY